ncbi:MAG: folylpolyglutamate synthase/dihydrofolate synthase family protein [Candidatus Omnitrophota bacterium]|nr:folylpolyglutamate synthase/dihydrofolate synthase family protein [Candidatus Omnitrophota bacterium]
MTYPEVISYLNSFANHEKNTNYSYKETFKLKRVKDFLSVIGDPQKSLRIIHVAGTKGKGSTCAFVAYILKEAGFCVGLYTSPHLSDFRERIRILIPVGVSLRGALATKQSKKRDCFAPAGLAMTQGMICDFEGMISQKELSALVKELKPAINKYNRQSKYGALSFFEVYTSLAFLYFKRKKVDFAVLETGLGGALDATNVAPSLVCGITPVSFEHVQKLGSTLGQIAGEKAGIIKNKGAIVISAHQDKEAAKIISDRCKRFQAKLYEVGKQIRYFKGKDSFTIKALRRDYKDLHLQLLGDHQMANASMAVGLVEALSFYGFNIGSQQIRLGLNNTIWPGRCEVIKNNPLVVLDGAQNLASAAVLRSAIRKNFSAPRGFTSGRKYKKLILILGISDDKDISGICKTLGPLADQVILTRAATMRATDPVKLASYFKRKVYLTQSVKEAKLLARSLAHKEDLILVTGSLFVVGEFRDVQR